MKPESMKHPLQSLFAGPSQDRSSAQDHPSAAGAGHRSTRQLLLGAAVGSLLVLSSCASLSVKRDTETSGTFSSSGRAFTIFSYVYPRPAIQIAHENVADAGLPNTHATKVTETDWGWFDWMLEIISVRRARVKGTWGFNGESLGIDPATVTDDN